GQGAGAQGERQGDQDVPSGRQNRRIRAVGGDPMRQIVTALILATLLVPVTAGAGFLDELQKVVNPETKQGKIFSGAKQVLSSTQDMDYKTERTIGESLDLEGMQRFGRPVNNEPLQRYVNLVGSALAANSKRPTIPY